MTNGERNTQKRSGESFAYDMAAGASVNKGALVALVAGYALAALEDPTAVTVGIAKESVDNTDGADGDATVVAEAGTYLLANAAGGDALTRADVGSDCFVLDDETVAKTDGGGSRAIAGLVRAVEGGGVWVTI